MRIVIAQPNMSFLRTQSPTETPQLSALRASQTRMTVGPWAIPRQDRRSRRMTPESVNHTNLQRIAGSAFRCGRNSKRAQPLRSLRGERYNGTLTGATLYHSAKLPFTFNHYAGKADVSHANAGRITARMWCSIVAGCDKRSRGVAYNAQIISMQVFQNGGAAWTEILRHLKTGCWLEVDAPNMSLGLTTASLRVKQIWKKSLLFLLHTA